jgi:hypothetical protein
MLKTVQLVKACQEFPITSTVQTDSILAFKSALTAIMVTKAQINVFPVIVDAKHVQDH